MKGVFEERALKGREHRAGAGGTWRDKENQVPVSWPSPVFSRRRRLTAHPCQALCDTQAAHSTRTNSHGVISHP